VSADTGVDQSSIASKLAPTGTAVFFGLEEAAEKRHPAENRCRFSGIAALPWPAKPRFPGFFELAWGLLS